MRTYIVTFRSVTYAQRGEALLSGAGIRCTLGRTPRWMEKQGCGYALWLKVNEAGGALALLRDAGIPPRRVWAQRADGKLEEVIV